MRIVWELAVVLDGCFAFQCVWSESRVSNGMPRAHSHIYSQSFDSCPVLFCLALETMLAFPQELLAWALACFVALGEVFF